MLGISGTELVIILFFGFLIFGPEKLPEMGRTVGRAIRQFRMASDAANQKFKEEVYDPFKDAVEPYAEEIKQQSAPLKEDLDAINSTLKETQQMFTDPFKLKEEPAAAASGTGKNAESKQPGIKSMVDDMLHDPFDIKKDEKAARDASIQESLDTADEIIETLENAKAEAAQARPLPETGGKVKVGLAESLYGLDGSDGQAEPEEGSAVKDGEQ